MLLGDDNLISVFYWVSKMELPQKILRPWLMVLQSIFQSMWNKRGANTGCKSTALASANLPFS